jgi:hypothetical protein
MGTVGQLIVDSLVACAQVELLRYPVPIGKQGPGQTMAAGAMTQCLKRYGEATLITALQCVTQTANNQPGALRARTIKALCDVLHRNPEWRESGLRLLEAFDSIDLMSLLEDSVLDAATKRVGRVQAMSERIQTELRRMPTPKIATKKMRQDIRDEDRNVYKFGH